MTLEWVKHSSRETWAAQTPVGLVTVALRSAAGRQKQWTALDTTGRRIAFGQTPVECMESAAYHAERLAKTWGPSR